MKDEELKVRLKTLISEIKEATIESLTESERLKGDRSFRMLGFGDGLCFAMGLLIEDFADVLGDGDE